MDIVLEARGTICFIRLNELSRILSLFDNDTQSVEFIVRINRLNSDANIKTNDEIIYIY